MSNDTHTSNQESSIINKARSKAKAALEEAMKASEIATAKAAEVKALRNNPKIIENDMENEEAFQNNLNDMENEEENVEEENVEENIEEINYRAIPLNDALQDFWKTLWHVDVYKDHKNDYNAKIINNFLPNNGVYRTDQEYNDTKITIKDKPADRNLGKNIEFEDLFGYLTGKNYTDLSKLPVGSTDNAQLNSTLLGPGIRYDIKIFDRNGNNMDKFIQGDKVAMYIDTASHIPEMMSTFRSQNNGSTLTYAYTREIESDPADKITYQTINKNLTNKDNQSSFYYEMTAPNNPTIIPYTSFTPNDNMSYFYCKWPLFLEYNGPTDKPGMPLNKRNYKLNVKLSYNRDGRPIKIEEGMNIAGAAKNALFKLGGIETPALFKEMIFISKHHGDVAQSLVKFRNVKMINPNEEERAKRAKEKGEARGDPVTINTNDYKGAFVSIDVNAIIKALTIQMPYIFMYPPDKKSIIVWKNVTNITPKNRYIYQRDYTRGKIEQYLKNVNAYNETIGKINDNKKNYDIILIDKLKCEFDGGAAFDPLAYYKKLIQEGFSLAVLSNYVPKNPLTQYEGINDDNKAFDNFNKDYIDDLVLDNLDDTIQKLKDIEAEFEEKSSLIKIPKDYGNLNMFDENKNARVAVEKEVALSFKRDGDKYIFQKSRNVKNVWDYIDFNFIVGKGRGTIPDSIECRSGTKLNSSWGIDIIQYIYTELKKYNKEEANKFILCLRKIVSQLDDDKKNTFNFGLSLVGINPIEIIQIGGTRFKWMPKLAATAKSRKSHLTRKQVNITQSQRRIEILATMYKKYYLQELSEIKNHLELMKDLTYLYNNYITDPKNNLAFNDKGLEILNTYANKQFGINIYTNVDNNVNISKNKNESILELNPKDNYYVSYSVIKYYNYIENQYEHFRDGFKIYYKLSKGSSPLDFSINTNDIEKELKSIEQLIAKLYINHWDESVIPVQVQVQVPVIPLAPVQVPVASRQGKWASRRTTKTNKFKPYNTKNKPKNGGHKTQKKRTKK